MAEKVVAQGTDLQIDNVSIPGVTSVTPPNRTRADIDFTDLLMAWKEFKPGVKDGGEVSAEINYDPENAVHASLHDAFESDDLNTWKVIYANTGGTVVSFSGYIKELSEPALAVDGKLMLSVKIKVSGAITIA